MLCRHRVALLTLLGLNNLNLNLKLSLNPHPVLGFRMNESSSPLQTEAPPQKDAPLPKEAPKPKSESGSEKGMTIAYGARFTV